jgi:TonB family protein
MKVARYAVLVVLAASAVCADDPSALFHKARQAHARGDDKTAMALLRKADAAWQAESPNAAEHAAALEDLALLMRNQAALDAQASGEAQPYATDVESWRSDAAPIVKRALEICEAASNTNPGDLALALELEGDILGRTEAGASYWERATKIRAQRVAAASGSLTATDATNRIGRDVSPPSILTKQEPNYTEMARLMRYSGTALFSVVIDAQGLPSSIRLIRGLGYGLDEKGAEAISTWRFRPAMKNGSPVAVYANIEVNFRLL